MQKRFLVVDDHVLFRRGVIQLLQEHFGKVICGEAGDLRQALTLLDGKDWDLVILDLCLGRDDGLDLLRSLNANTRVSRPAVLVLSMYPEEQVAKTVLRMGARGYVSKDAAHTELLRAVDRVIGGGTFLSENVAQMIAREWVSGHGKEAGVMLSPREKIVLRRVSEGHSIRAIAADLGVSPKTVSTFRGRLLKKLNLKTNADLVRWTLRNELFPNDHS